MNSEFYLWGMERLSRVVASVFGIGQIPFITGTWGAVAGAVVWYLIYHNFTFLPATQIGLTIGLIILGIITAGDAEKRLGPNPNQVVIDEFAGMWVSLLLLPFSGKYLLAAFIMFRYFDIIQPLGIRRLTGLKGGIGIMADDILAGVYANLVVRALILLNF